MTNKQKSRAEGLQCAIYLASIGAETYDDVEPGLVMCLADIYSDYIFSGEWPDEDDLEDE